MTKQVQTVRQVEIIHTSLTGLAMIGVVLLIGLLLPVFGYNALRSPAVAAVVVWVALIGIGTLYLMNYHAHKIVQEQARLTDVLINSLGQGFLTFDAKGLCGSVYSQACHTLLQAEEIEFRSICEVIKVAPEAQADFFEWLSVLFMPDHALSFEDAVRFLPTDMPREDGRTVQLSYRPVRGRDNQLHRIVLIATDRTDEADAQKRADAEHQFAAMICAIFTERQNFMLTMSEMKDMLDHLMDDISTVDAAFFLRVHTLKGAAMHFRMEKLSETLHGLETVLRDSKSLTPDEMREKLAQSRAEVQLEYGRIQLALRDILGTSNQQTHGLIEVDEESVYNFGKLLERQQVSPDIVHAYQTTILSVPLFSLLSTLDRQMAQVAERLEKKIKPIQFTGDAVRMPARPLQHLLLALTHVVHNILDHGIESPLARMAKNKDAAGLVTIHVQKTNTIDGRWVEITIADDGAGIDPNKVRSRLMDVDPEGNWRFEDDQLIIQKLLTHDISTRDEVSMLSGRGAGMSAIYQEVVRLGGTCELRSVMHHGTHLIIRLPQTLAA